MIFNTLVYSCENSVSSAVYVTMIKQFEDKFLNYERIFHKKFSFHSWASSVKSYERFKVVY